MSMPCVVYTVTAWSIQQPKRYLVKNAFSFRGGACLPLVARSPFLLALSSRSLACSLSLCLARLWAGVPVNECDGEDQRQQAIASAAWSARPAGVLAQRSRKGYSLWAQTPRMSLVCGPTPPLSRDPPTPLGAGLTFLSETTDFYCRTSPACAKPEAAFLHSSWHAKAAFLHLSWHRGDASRVNQSCLCKGRCSRIKGGRRGKGT